MRSGLASPCVWSLRDASLGAGKRCAAALVLLSLALLLAGCSGGGEGRTEAKPDSARETGARPLERTSATREESASGCRAVDPDWGRFRPPSQFFPSSRAGLWLRENRCLYLVFGGKERARLLWSAPSGARVRGLVWAPDGRSFAVTTHSGRAGWRVVLVRRDGVPLRRLRATGAGFFSDGRLAVSQLDGLYLVARVGKRPLVSRVELERVAGFRVRPPLLLSHDPWGFTRGSGRDGLAVTLWSRIGWKSVVVVVSAVGRLARASPAYRAGGGEGVVSGWAWSPDGRKLFVMAEVAGPPERRRRGSHDHCLDVWSGDGGRRSAFCESGLPRPHQSHFSKLAWSVDGGKGLLDNGTIVTRDGDVAGRIPVRRGALAFELQWEPTPV